MGNVCTLKSFEWHYDHYICRNETKVNFYWINSWNLWILLFQKNVVVDFFTNRIRACQQLFYNNNAFNWLIIFILISLLIFEWLNWVTITIIFMVMIALWPFSFTFIQFRILINSFDERREFAIFNICFWLKKNHCPFFSPLSSSLPTSQNWKE